MHVLLANIRCCSLYIVAPSIVVIFHDQYTKTGATVNVTWSPTRGADNYTISVTSVTMTGKNTIITTTDTTLLLTAVYNEKYAINITAQNCVESNSTVAHLIVSEFQANDTETVWMHVAQCTYYTVTESISYMNI